VISLDRKGMESLIFLKSWGYGRLRGIKRDLVFYKDIYRNYLSLRKRGIWMAGIYSDHMVMQRDKVLKIRGHASAGMHIVLFFANHTARTITGSDGNWCCIFPAIPAGGPYLFVVKGGRHKLVFKDVYVGEVWLVSGLSLMMMGLTGCNSWEEEQEWWGSQKDESRFIVRYCKKRLPKGWPDRSFPRALCKLMGRFEIPFYDKWKKANPANLGEIPAYAYYFAKMLASELRVPVGVLCTALPGCPMEGYIERELLMEKAPDILSGTSNRFTLDTGARGRRDRNLGNTDHKKQNYFLDPGFAFESQIRSLDAFPVRGAIYGIFWSTKEFLPFFPLLFPLLPDSWYRLWREKFPIYFLQPGRWNNAPLLPFYRDQLRVSLKGSDMCKMLVGYDTHIRTAEGEDYMHPLERKTVGERFARLALYYQYGKKEIVPEGPLYHEAVLRDNFIRIKFEWSEGLHTSDGQTLREFEVSGEDECFIPVNAWIENDTVIISCPESLPLPVYVRHAWKDFTEANLVNGAGLPASTFVERLNN
jgi:sialate O-acetylesterase